MKKIATLLLLVSLTGMAQIKGNKQIETRNFNIDGLTHIKINFYAKVTIDQSAKEEMTITTDSNLFKHIDTEVVDGVLHLDQKKWISPSQDAVIFIGAPDLIRVETGTHDTTRIINVNNDYLNVLAPIGNIFIEGQTKELRIGAELATVDALQLKAEKVNVNLWNWGKVKVNATQSLWAEVSNEGKLIYSKKPDDYNVKTKKGGLVYALKDINKIKNPEAVYISFKIKNNSLNRNNFQVVGPKQDGSKFGYGFPMMPNAVRKENWTVGTKVYKVSSLGFKKLICVIKKEDEGKTIKLFNED